jgi:hypothetical protein
MKAGEKEKLTRIKRRLEGRVDFHRKAADKARNNSPAECAYHYGARDEAQKILEMFQIEFNNELRIVNIVTKGDTL